MGIDQRGGHDARAKARFHLPEAEKTRRLNALRHALQRATPQSGQRPGRRPTGHYSRTILAPLCFFLGLGALAFAFFSWLGSPTVRQAGARMEIVIPAALDGHHYLDGAINGQPVTFLIDSGASYVSVSHGLAQQLGLARGNSATFMTATGPVSGQIVADQGVAAGGFGPLPLSVSVMPGSRPMALLGQNFLRHVETVQANRQLILRGTALPASKAPSPARIRAPWVALAGVALLIAALALRSGRRP